jgi:DNA uptake protein ComE-like DNA-binding protein
MLVGGVSDADGSMNHFQRSITFDRQPPALPGVQLGDKSSTSNRRRSRLVQARSGSVLILTLVVVAMLTLGAAAFFERMFAEHQAERAHGQQLQASQLADSGVEYMKVLLSRDPQQIQDAGGLYANPSLFQGIVVNDDPMADFRGRVTLFAPELTADGYFGGIRYGLENESARLNLNTVLLADTVKEGNAKTILMGLPGMTEMIAEAILDWIDPDEEQRESGAEREYYGTLDPPYAPRNGPLGSIEELLLVRGVTPALLFGADLNRNGVIDGNEQNLANIDNADNSNGVLNRGWAAYLTVDSAEANVRPDGKPKIDLNMDKLEDLQKQLAEVLDKDQADFIIAYRQGGPYTGNDSAKPISGQTLDLTQKGNVKLSTILDLIGVKTRIAKQSSSSSGSGGSSGTQSKSKSSNDSHGSTTAQSVPSTGPSSGGGSGGDDSKNSRVVIEPAFPNDKSAMTTYLPKLMENCAVNAAPSIPGRLNINQAPRALLLGVPGFTPEMVDQIISHRDVTMGTQRPEQKYETWLLTDDVVDLKTMKQLMPLITGGGSVYRAQVAGGFFVPDGPVHRVEVLVDATKKPAIVRRRWELSDLGRGYTPEVLGAEADDAR